MSDFPFKIRALSLYDRKIVEGYYVGPGQIMNGSSTMPFYPGTMSVLTGRKDVNGRDIYTNDIVKCTVSQGGCSTEFNGVCHYDESRCAFEVAGTGQSMGLADMAYVNSGNFHSCSNRRFEVIGSMLDNKIKLYQQTCKL